MNEEQHLTLVVVNETFKSRANVELPFNWMAKVEVLLGNAKPLLQGCKNFMVAKRKSSTWTKEIGVWPTELCWSE